MAETNTKLSGTAIGYITAIIQAITYATIGIFGKFLYAVGLDAQQVVVLRFAFTVLFLGVMLMVWRKHKLISRQPALYVQSIFFFVSAWLYFLAVENMNAGLVTVVFYTFPCVVAVLNVFVMHEKLTGRTLLALALSVVGVVFISGVLGGGDVVDPLGIAFALASCLAFSVYSVLIQKTARVDSSFTATFTLSLVSLMFALIVFFPELPAIPQFINLNVVLLCGGLAIIATIAPIVLYIVAVRYIGATKASIISLAETPASLAMAWMILGETLTIWQGVGSILIMAAILVITIKAGE